MVISNVPIIHFLHITMIDVTLINGMSLEHENIEYRVILPVPAHIGPLTVATSLP